MCSIHHHTVSMKCNHICESCSTASLEIPSFVESFRVIRLCAFNFNHKFIQSSCAHVTKYLQFEGVSVVGAGSEVSVDSGTTTEWSSIRWLLVITILWLHTFSVAGWRVGSAHSLTTWTQTHTLDIYINYKMTLKLLCYSKAETLVHISLCIWGKAVEIMSTSCDILWYCIWGYHPIKHQELEYYILTPVFIWMEFGLLLNCVPMHARKESSTTSN